MKSKALYRFAILLTLAASIRATFAATLNEGDAAPKLTVSKWIQGEPVKAFQPGTVYLVNFWSSWWIPCMEAMAHVNHLHHKYQGKGLVVIGQDVKERPATKIEPVIKRLGDLMSYRIATDEAATSRWVGKMQEDWLFAAEVGLPAAFLIDKNGKIAFIGHPDDIDDAMIEQLLAGTFDPKTRVLAREAAAKKAEQWDSHNELGKAAFKAKEWSTAMREIDEMEKLYPNKRVAIQFLRIPVLMGQGDFDAAIKLAQKLSDEDRNDPYLQHRIARTIAKGGPTNAMVLNTANQIIERANALTKGPVPEFLHTQARIVFLQGKSARAIQLETEASSLADVDTKDQFEVALDSFKHGKLPR
jgi:thiol-disulfide isomerase/thioredoxin